jgi:hypothetical protein
MQLSCPTCDAALSAQDIDFDRALVTCPACDSVTDLAQLGGPAVRTRALTAPKRKLREVPRPDHYSIKDDGSSLRIKFRWIWRTTAGGYVIVLIWNCFVVLWYWNALRTGGPWIWLAILFTIPHGAIGLFLAYGTLAALLNRTVITVTSEFFIVRHGPVPWWGNRKLPTDELDRLYCDKDAESKEKKGGHCRYSVFAQTKEASTVELVNDLQERDQALFIVQEVERWLNKGDASSFPTSMHDER